MILSVCTSPCLDVTVFTDKTGKILKDDSIVCGGKGINVAVSVKKLGGDSFFTGIMFENDNVFCARFDNYRESSIKKVSEFSKEYLMKLINENIRENISKYGMQEAISFTTAKIIPNILKESNAVIKEDNKCTKKEYILDSKGVINDNYIFQFILTSDYTFSSYEQNNTFKNNNADFYDDVYQSGSANLTVPIYPMSYVKFTAILFSFYLHIFCRIISLFLFSYNLYIYIFIFFLWLIAIGL